ncbi:MAG: putative membrane protein [Kiritimatiellia bacterium]|jgi:putative membrane protein
MDLMPHLLHFGLTVVYVILGVAMFGLSFLVVTWITPFSIQKEIEEDQNTSLGIIIGSLIIGIAIIVAAGITGQ